MASDDATTETADNTAPDNSTTEQGTATASAPATSEAADSAPQPRRRATRRASSPAKKTASPKRAPAAQTSSSADEGGEQGGAPESDGSTPATEESAAPAAASAAKRPVKATATRRQPRAAAKASSSDAIEPGSDTGAESESDADAESGSGAASRAASGAAAPRSRARRASAAQQAPDPHPSGPDDDAARADQSDDPDSAATDNADSSREPAEPDTSQPETAEQTAAVAGLRRPEASFGVLFQAPTLPPTRPSRRRSTRAAEATPEDGDTDRDRFDEDPTDAVDSDTDASSDDAGTSDTGDSTDTESTRRRRRRGGRGRRRTGDDSTSDGDSSTTSDSAEDTDISSSDDSTGDDQSGEEDNGTTSTRRRTRRRRRTTSATDDEDPPGTVTRVREPRRERTEATGISGSTRLEAKRQRRRESREAGRRRTVITEAEFLARRESVERVMVVRQRDDRTQIGVLEDGVLVEHYVSTAGAGQGGANGTGTSVAGNVYLGRVQNVLPSMEAAFVDVGKGRNAVLYAGEVNWDAAGLESSKNRRIELALSSGQSVLVQVTKDPIGHKGARLTSQISLPGRYLVYVPDGTMTGISRKLPDTERNRLKKILRDIVPDNAGVIVRTAAEGATEAELTADVERLTKVWEAIQRKAKTASAPSLLHGEVDLTVRVIRDVFNEDFTSLVVGGDAAWRTINDYVESVAPDLAPRLSKWTGEEDVFAHYRIDEQLAKALDRKVWLPSGGSLVIDRTEAMTVVDVNTGKFVGSGGNLEETVTKNNLEAAEEIVRQLRLRDIGGIIVIDFIDMVLESNRDLVVRRLLECLGRDRTKHQVAEVTSLGLVQMTRKRVGSGLLEVFSTSCEHCQGRGVLVADEPVERSSGSSGNGGSSSSSRSGRGRRGRSGSGTSGSGSSGSGSRGSGGSGGSGGTAAAGSGEAESPGGRSELASAGGGTPGGPTPAQIAAQAYAAARQAAGQETLEDDASAHEDAGPDVTAGEPGPVTDADSAPPASSVSGPEGEPDADLVEPSSSTGYPAPRARRKRPRVVAPAGPPRSHDDSPTDGETPSDTAPADAADHEAPDQDTPAEPDPAPAGEEQPTGEEERSEERSVEE